MCDCQQQEREVLTVMVTLRIPPSYRDRLRAEAQKRDMSVGKLTRKIIDHYMTEQEQQNAA